VAAIKTITELATTTRKPTLGLRRIRLPNLVAVRRCIRT
jgi:hypothetical protein